MNQLSSLPTWALGAIVVLGIVQITVEIWALVDLIRRPNDRVNGNKIIWILIIVLVNLIGAIVYFVAGRKPAPAEEPKAPAASGEAARRAVDALYGPGGDAQ